jgi:cholesterol transport system auxiliary component
MKIKKTILVLAILITGCSVTPQSRTSSTVYDLGLIRSADSSSIVQMPTWVSLMVADAVSPTWLDSQTIQYRLAYHDPSQSHGYANSRWAASPAALITHRVRSHLASVTQNAVLGAGDGVRTDYILRIGLEEFSQVFDTPDQSRVVVRLRASLVSRGGRQLLSQRNFSIDQETTQPDATGAVHALTIAVDRLTGELTEWIATELVEDGRRAVK